MLVEEIKNKLSFSGLMRFQVISQRWNSGEQMLRLDFEPGKYMSVKRMLDRLHLIVVTGTSLEDGNIKLVVRMDNENKVTPRYCPPERCVRLQA